MFVHPDLPKPPEPWPGPHPQPKPVPPEPPPTDPFPPEPEQVPPIPPVPPERRLCGVTKRSTNRVSSLVLATAMLMLGAACHPGPILNRSDQRVGGTIAGVVTATKGAIVLSGRKVTAVNVVSGEGYSATTNITGGYTIKVPEGTYRVELEIREGETLTKQPGETHVNNGDLDPDRNFEVTASAR